MYPSDPHKMMGIRGSTSRILPVHIIDMVRDRSTNQSGRASFTLADRAHLLKTLMPDQVWAKEYTSNLMKIGDCQFSAPGNFSYVSHEGGINIYDVRKGQDPSTNWWDLQSVIRTNGLFQTVSMSPDEQYLFYSARCAQSYDVCIAKIQNEEQNYRVMDDDDSDHKAMILFSKFSSNGEEVLTLKGELSMRRHQLVLFNTTDLGIKRVFNLEKGGLDAFDYADADSNVIYGGTSDSCIVIWDKRERQPVLHCQVLSPAGDRSIFHINSRGDGIYFISSTHGRGIDLWDVRYLRNNANPNPYDMAGSVTMPVASFPIGYPFTGGWFSPSFSTGQRFIYTGSVAGGMALIFDAAEQTIIQRLNAPYGFRDSNCSWHPEYPIIIGSSRLDKKLLTWKLTEKKLTEGEIQLLTRKLTRGLS